MTKTSHRIALLAALALMTAPATVFAQGATNAPAGGTATTTAPSNSEGAPAGGSGTVSTTRVAPSSTTTTRPAHRTTRHRTTRHTTSPQ